MCVMCVMCVIEMCCYRSRCVLRFIHLAMIKTILTPESHVLPNVATVSLSLAQPHHRAPAGGEMAVQQQRSSAVVWTQDSDRLLLERIQHFVKQGLEVLLLLLLPLLPLSVAVAGGGPMFSSLTRSIG